MRFIWFMFRLFRKLASLFRRIPVKVLTGCHHSKFDVLGKVYVWNPNVKLGENVVLYPDVMFFGDGVIEIGDNVVIGKGSIIGASKEGGVFIGKNTMIAAQCYVIDSDHGMKKEKPMREQDVNSNPVYIGEDCWLGAGCKVLKGTNIHDGVVVGAQSVVKGQIEDDLVIVGVPARAIKQRS